MKQKSSGFGNQKKRNENQLRDQKLQLRTIIQIEITLKSIYI